MVPRGMSIPTFGNRPLYFRRNSVTALTSAATGASGWFFSGCPSSSASFDTDFGGLFNAYLAVKTHYHFIPALNTNELVSGDTLFLTPLYTVNDPVDTTVPTTEAEMLQYGSLKVHSLTNEFRRTIMPSVALSLNSGNAFPGSRAFWVSIGSDPQMNGLKMLLPDMGQAAATPIGRMITTYEFYVNVTH